MKRFASARNQAEVRLAELESVQTADRHLKEEGNRAIANREAICRRVELLSGIVPSETIQQLRDEWAALAGEAASDPDVTTDGGKIADQLSALDQRFERALGAVEERPGQLRESQARLVEVGNESSPRWKALAKNRRRIIGRKMVGARQCPRAPAE